MKRSRKGFTLVELLIVMAIIAALTATMAVSMKKSVAKAKAAAILSNFDSAKSAAATYYALHVNDTTLALTAENALKSSMAGWNDATVTKGTVTYGAEGTTLANDAKWYVTATFTTDPSAKQIADALDDFKAGIGDGSTTLTVVNGTGEVYSAKMDITPE